MRRFTFSFFPGLLFCLTPTLAQPTLRAPDLNAAAGSVVAVALQLEGGGELTGLQFLLDYDENLLTPSSQPLIGGDLLSTHTYVLGQPPGPLAGLVFSAVLDTFGIGCRHSAGNPFRCRRRGGFG